MYVGGVWNNSPADQARPNRAALVSKVWRDEHGSRSHDLPEKLRSIVCREFATGNYWVSRLSCFCQPIASVWDSSLACCQVRVHQFLNSKAGGEKIIVLMDRIGKTLCFLQVWSMQPLAYFAVRRFALCESSCSSGRLQHLLPVCLAGCNGWRRQNMPLLAMPCCLRWSQGQR